MNKFNDKSIYRFLKKLGAMRTVAPSEVIPILDVLDWFYWIVIGCFGWNLVADYREIILFIYFHSIIYYTFFLTGISSKSLPSQ